jgi:ubiquinone/menaquinone biosynthesis C-methylase UbiE
MGFYEERILPRFIDLTLGTAKMGKLRARALDGVSGTVLELGFGSGTNLPYYPDAVERVLAVDPSGGARAIAAKRIAASPIAVEFVGLDGAAIALEDDSVDHAVSTWTLCTIPDVDAALREVRRVLKPGGQLHFLEHGRSDVPRISRRQDRFDPWQQRIAGGCHLNRDHGALLEASGLRVDDVATFSIAGPKSLSFMYAGTATNE